MDWGAFAVGFMNDQSKSIQKRLERAEDYKERQLEKADRSKAEFGKRKLVVSRALGKAKRLKGMGVTDEMIAAAASSGPTGIFDFADELTAYATKNNITGRFTQSQLKAITDTPELLKEDLGDDFNLTDHLNKTFGVGQASLGSTTSGKRNILQKAFGLGLTQATRADLDREAYYDGYSVMDINEMAAQDAYSDLLPGSTFRFTPGLDYDSAKVSTDFSRALSLNLDNAKVDIDAMEYGGAKEPEINAFKQQIREDTIRSYASSYGVKFLNDSSLRLEEKFPELHAELIAKYGTGNTGDSALTKVASPKVEEAIIKKVVDNNSTAETAKTTDAKDQPIEYKFIFHPKTGIPQSATVNGEVFTGEEAITMFNAATSQGLFLDRLTAIEDFEKFGTEVEQSLDESLGASPASIIPDEVVADKETNTVTREPELVQTQTEDKVKKLEVSPYKLSDGRTQYIITNEEGIRIEGTPVFSTYEAAQGAIVANESPSMTRELDPVEPEVFSSASSDIYDNPTDATYLVKIDGMLGTFRVKADDLQYIPREKVKVGKASSEQVSIMSDDKPDKRRKSLSGSRLRRLFKTEKGLGDTETLPTQEVDLKSVMREFLAEAGTTDRNKLAKLWPDYAMQAGVSVLDADKILANIQKSQ